MSLSHDAMKTMYEEFSDEIYRFICWQTGDSILAEDLTSEVFFKSWKNRATFNDDNRRAWLYKIARNLIADHWRKKKAVPLDDVAEPVADYDLPEEVARRQEVELVRKIIAELATDHKTVITLRLLEKLPYKEISEVMGKSEGNVRVLHTRALKEFNKRYEQYA